MSRRAAGCGSLTSTAPPRTWSISATSSRGVSPSALEANQIAVQASTDAAGVTDLYLVTLSDRTVVAGLQLRDYGVFAPDYQMSGVVFSPDGSWIAFNSPRADDPVGQTAVPRRPRPAGRDGRPRSAQFRGYRFQPGLAVMVAGRSLDRGRVLVRRRRRHRSPPDFGRPGRWPRSEPADRSCLRRAIPDRLLVSRRPEDRPRRPRTSARPI